ncbi:uncharacterized protein N7498_005238 [Penicillium cinerascens]|uniref:penicillopepsin n=1 Tax=Penicillium cinerascens TaxID=70096 RepID=A0A9W9MN38_9EURO|nr:uncharacterized protein N7498_005238 [Penicillium cinerascens]KAJ5204359.1 hypothetical protein N7498_005238 [Penicillium cinerascens]
MVVFSKVTAILAGLTAVTSAVPVENTRKGFTINQVANPATKTKPINLPAMYARALAKFGGTVPASVKAAAERGSATTYPQANDEDYLTPVTVGAGTLNLNFDTGSADLWVFSSELPASEQAGHTLYTPSSSASQIPGATWSISYDDGSSASGNVFDDVVDVGGVTATSQAVEAAETVSQEFLQNTASDGLLGLAFSIINTVRPTQQTTFFDTVKSQLDLPLFAVTLKHNAPGTFDFGYLDSSKYTGSIAYTPVDSSQGFWTFTADSYTIAGSTGSSITGFADTGTTLLLLDSDIVAEYYSQVPGAQMDSSAGGYVFDCSSTLPDFIVTISGYNAVVPGAFINYAPISQGGSTCFGGIQANSGPGMSIFGDIFLKSQYVVFDSSGPQLGFAAQA